MQIPDLPPDEAQRLATLRGLNLLDTPAEERFDRLTRLAKRLFGVPIVLISLVDAHRQWFKSCVGLDMSETPREISFCGHAILADEIFLIPDATQDPRFADNPLVTGEPHIRFYAGCPLSVGVGGRLGTLCLIDTEPRQMGADDLALLRDLARMAEQELAAVQMATLDELTGLSNRRGFMALAQHALQWCQRHRQPATLLYMDLDEFKPINDRFGHAEGDLALKAFAQCLGEAFRGSDVIARQGGDEFLVLLTESTPEQASAALERLRSLLQAYNRSSARGYALDFSVGAVSFDRERHATLDAWLAAADQAMYAAKRARKLAGPR